MILCYNLNSGESKFYKNLKINTIKFTYGKFLIDYANKVAQYSAPETPVYDE